MLNIKPGDFIEIVLTKTTGDRVTYIINDQEACEILEEFIDSRMVTETADEFAEPTDREKAEIDAQRKYIAEHPETLIPHEVVMKVARALTADAAEETKRRNEELAELRALISKFRKRRSDRHSRYLTEAKNNAS